MDDRIAEGGHDGKAAAPKRKSSAGKAVGYSDADPADTATGKDGLLPPQPTGPKQGEA